MDRREVRARLVSLVCAALVAGMAAVPTRASDLVRIVASVDAATSLGSMQLRDRDLLSVRRDGIGSVVLSTLGNLLPDGVGVDAISLVADNRLVFSTDVSFIAGGIGADDEDLVLCDRGVLSLVFDGSAAGLPEKADIDAVHVLSLSPVDLLYSVDAPIEVGGIVIADDDIVRFDGATHTVVRTGASLIGDETARADVDALWFDPSGNEYVISLDVAIEAGTGRTAADADDLVRWANGSLTMYFDASAAGVSVPGLDVDAVSFDFAFFADNFETGDTTMWSSTTP
jgi:hypothetical protein